MTDNRKLALGFFAVVVFSLVLICFFPTQAQDIKDIILFLADVLFGTVAAVAVTLAKIKPI